MVQEQAKGRWDIAAISPGRCATDPHGPTPAREICLRSQALKTSDDIL
jgi:hypothetical protein